MTPEAFADELAFSLQHAILAHQKHPNTPKDALRFWDNTTPYAIHPIWCAVTLLTETRLSAEVRYNGYQALLWHDTLEDTRLPLPEGTRPEVRRLVEEMTFEGFDDELQNLWTRSETARLLKLYDKVSILLDAVWMKDAAWDRIVRHAWRLAEEAEARYGELNIVKIARTICVLR